MMTASCLVREWSALCIRVSAYERTQVSEDIGRKQMYIPEVRGVSLVVTYIQDGETEERERKRRGNRRLYHCAAERLLHWLVSVAWCMYAGV